MSRRHDRKDDLGWESPVNLGCISDGYVNSPAHEVTPSLFEDETGTAVMYFASRRAHGDHDIYATSMRHDGTFGPGDPVAELNSPSPYLDQGAAVRRDGLEVIFASDRPGGLGDYDLWGATRESTKDPWSAPVNLAVLSSPDYEDGKMCFSFDGLQIYFASNRAGGYSGWLDLYVATREKLRGEK